MDTAEDMLRAGRAFYAVFMCHLSVEKAAKGLYHRKLGRIPPKTHNIVFLLREVSVRPPRGLDHFIASLDDAHIATRYPDDIDKLASRYDTESAREILNRGKETTLWIKTQL